MARQYGIQVHRKKLPEDVNAILMEKQAQFGLKCLCKYSMERTLLRIIRFVKDKKIT